MNEKSPSLVIVDAWYDYIRGNLYRDELQQIIKDILVNAGIPLKSAEAAVDPLDKLDMYFPWEEYFPDLPSSFC